MNDLRTAAQQALDDLRDLHANHNITYAGTISRLEAALAQQAAPERHFCERCGKRLSQDGIHTCTPPQQAEPVEEPAPMPPFPPISQWKLGCAVCGIGADGNAYGYVCPRSDCPTKVTCGGVA